MGPPHLFTQVCISDVCPGLLLSLSPLGPVVQSWPSSGSPGPCEGVRELMCPCALRKKRRGWDPAFPRGMVSTSGGPCANGGTGLGKDRGCKGTPGTRILSRQMHPWRADGHCRTPRSYLPIPQAPSGQGGIWGNNCMHGHTAYEVSEYSLSGS